jgi:hypothetical protein
MEERKFIEELKCVNKMCPIRTVDEKTEYYRQRSEEFRKTHQEEIKDYKQKYQVENKEMLKEKKRIYYEDNKNVLNEKNKLHYENNKESILLKGSTPYQCECGSICRIDQKARHFKSLKHITFKNNNII